VQAGDLQSARARAQVIKQVHRTYAQTAESRGPRGSQVYPRDPWHHGATRVATLSWLGHYL
jgi:hypothetical protein